MDQIVGTVERITFQSEDSGYTVAKIRIQGRRDLTCVVGTLPGLAPGETIRCFGKWIRHLVHGLQFEVEKHKVERPADLEAIRKYLGSGLIKGIGPIYAKKIVDTFGIQTLELIDESPQRLKEVPGVGKKRAADIAACWEEQRSIRSVMLFLQSHNISPTWAQRIYKTYGNQAIEKVSQNPYLLARDIRGMGFQAADKIAETMGITGDADERIDASIEYVIAQAASEGHTCLPLSECVEKVTEMVEITDEKIKERLPALEKEQRIALHPLLHQGEIVPFIWATYLYRSEIGLVNDLARLEEGRSSLRKVDRQKALDWVQKLLSIQLAEKQKSAVAAAIEEKLLIITGGPGTGKSTITNAILKITEKLSEKILLAAPTGRAAKRMSEITGREAKTIHSLLEFDFRKGGFRRGRESPLECDLILVDEASMIDTLLMYQLIRALPSHTKLLLVGDIHQLPSVGPGNVLKELIASKLIPTVVLNEIFRQKEGSAIIKNAHRINKGAMPEVDQRENTDFFFFQEEEPERVQQTIAALIADRIPKRFGLHPIDEIQVLAPMKRGLIGTESLNSHLQEILNPKPFELIRFGRRYRVGDKVMQIRNNYKKEVFNGDIGRIAKIDQTDQILTVSIDGRPILYSFSDLDELQLAYAISIHKSQGSEFPCVVIPIHTSHFVMLCRNILYTGVTRGKKLVILVGNKRALALAVKNSEVQHRFSGLLPAIREKRLQRQKCTI